MDYKLKINFYLIALVILQTYPFIYCSSVEKNSFAESIENEKSVNSSPLNMKFVGFNAVSPKLDIQIRNIQKNETTQQLECSNLIYTKSKKIDSKEIEVNLDSGQYCLDLRISYLTFNPYGKVETANTIVEFSPKQYSCVTNLNYNSVSTKYSCGIFMHYDEKILFAFRNNNSGKIYTEMTMIGWTVTILSLLAPNPYYFLGIIPPIFYGSYSEINRIEFQVK